MHASKGGKALESDTEGNGLSRRLHLCEGYISAHFGHRCVLDQLLDQVKGGSDVRCIQRVRTLSTQADDLQLPGILSED